MLCMQQLAIYINWDLLINAKCAILICFVLNPYQNIAARKFVLYAIISN